MRNAGRQEAEAPALFLPSCFPHALGYGRLRDPSPNRHLQRQHAEEDTERRQREPGVAFMIAAILEALDVGPLQSVNIAAGREQAGGIVGGKVTALADTSDFL